VSIPRRLGRPHNSAVHVTGAAIAASIFLADISIPWLNELEHLYTLSILLGLLTTWGPYIPIATVVSTALAAATEVTRAPEAPPQLWLLNTFLESLLFLLVGLFVTRYKRLQAADAANIDELSTFKAALDEAAIVARTSVDGLITYVNDRFCEISGYPREELLGQDHRIINSRFHSKEFIQNLWRTIANGRVWKGEIRNRSKDGQWYWVDTTIVPFLDPRGKPYQYVAIRHDVTARKLAEEKLTRQESLARVGQLAAVVAHEVRNPLAGIKGVLQVLMSRRHADDAELPLMRDVVDRIDALSDLINDLMVFARPRPARVSGFDLRPVLEELVKQARRDPVIASLGIQITGDATVHADGELVHSAVLNLLLNAGQAMGGRGTVVIAVSRTNGVVTIEVRDSGPGIPADIRDRVLEPFFTTKARGGGLGLAIAQRTAELHGGSLILTCPDGGGTIAQIRLADRTPAAAE
jgi:PAS domain S-box-containing protein